MSNCFSFSTVKLQHWLLALGVSVCLGIVVFTQVVSQNGNLVSSVSGFWMGIAQSSNVSSVTQVDAYRNSTFKNNEEFGNLSSGDDGVKYSSGSPVDGFLVKELNLETEVMNHEGTLGDVDRAAGGTNYSANSPRAFSPVGSKSVDTDDRAAGKISGGTNYSANSPRSFSPVGSKSVDTDDRAAGNISGGTNYYANSPLSFSPVIAVSSRKSSDKINQNVSGNSNIEVSLHDGLTLNARYKLKTDTEPLSVSDMVLTLRKPKSSSRSLRPRWSSVREKELLLVKQQLQNAPILHGASKLDASIYRNVSNFRRSYELMEGMLKVYVYREGEKPVFHQPMLDGIYASEGWFIKLIEEDKQFTVQDPSDAHLFFLPFSVKRLRAFFYGSFHGWKSRTTHIDNYVDLISSKYPFWNRSRGADHFLVACHDWGLRLTSGRTKNCIRSLCNSNAADGFRIGKDVTLPVTFVRKANEPLRDLGAKLPSKRTTLAFFAGSMHGDLRPKLVKYWQNKEPDMVILGSLPRNGQGQKIYRDHMKNSKYCICAKGYEVHTPRIVEAIFQECVPVIIADNYVPPFLEVLNWESFAVFVKEKDVSSLRQILVDIPQHKYRLMQQRVKAVQQHFLWHKNPVRYDLFHMILHSVWHTRLSQK